MKISVLILLLGFSMMLSAESSVKSAYYRSYNYEKLEDYDNAIEALIPLYQQYPEGYTLNLRLGWLYYLRRSYANSLSHYKRAMLSVPSSNEARLGYVLPLLAQEKWAEAEEVLYAILKVDYYAHTANQRLAYCLRMQKKTELAEKIAQKMLALSPTSVIFLGELALAKLALKQTDAAAAIYHDILILDPENAAARTYLGQ